MRRLSLADSKRSMDNRVFDRAMHPAATFGFPLDMVAATRSIKTAHCWVSKPMQIKKYKSEYVKDNVK